jgi:transposase
VVRTNQKARGEGAEDDDYRSRSPRGLQQIAFVDAETGELDELRLGTVRVRRSCTAIWRRRMKVRVGMEASGHARWFDRFLAELQFELWIGDAAEIRA